ncbi:probable DNA mismatch repair protein Msh6 [Leptidea sinapis]|uniref:probable DNA mismatch repair protein Msh6 n=1 Tax=Leptidea sinapis TaxID=189913 RepID=UPI0021C3E347|nr:probable DNA mismatch repair protein Msh6 [Leptidea sinapis]
MSKRNSLPSSNTLFNYFSKTPPSNKKAKANNDEESSLQSSVSENKFESKKRERESTPSPDNKNNNENCEKESPIASKKRKRIRINPIDSDDSDVENKVDNKIEVSKISTEKRLQDSFTYEPSDPSKSTKGKVVSRPSVPAKKPEAPEPQSVADEGNWVHCRLDWLKPDKVRDARRRRPDDPDYDPTTLHVPEEFLKTQTPAHKQWWELKSTHYDCVLFFKVGKFYELYHMDAAVGVNELGFSYMKGDFAHSGFPESAYARMASTLVSKGYKVARVEQTETPEMMQDRCKREYLTSKFDKVVRREICQLSVKGAEVCGLQDNGPSEANSPFMLTIAEEVFINFSHISKKTRGSVV